MGYVLLTPPSGEPLTLAEAKAHIRVDHSDDDMLIGALISASRQKFERDTNRKLVQQQWRMSLDRYEIGPLRTDYGPVISVDALKFTDFDMNVTTVDPSQYLVDTSSLVARLTPPIFEPWPWIYWAEVYRPFGRLLPGAVQVDFTAGYGTIDEDGVLVPAAGKDVTQFQLIKQTMLMIVGHWYNNRETVLGGEGRFMAIEMPMAAQELLDSFRIDSPR